MENRKEEFLKIICQIYMAAVLVVLPLYYIPGNGYYKLGDSKYYLYRNVSLICLAVCIVVITADLLIHRQRKNWGKFSKVTIAVCMYGFCALLSAICSPYGRTAWMGEREWYMGAVTICLMAGGFLLTAAYAGQCRQILYLGEASFAIVTIIGLFQKLGYDPLGLLKGYVVGDWEYTHMLSTLGNNNWLSGYYSVMLPVSLVLFQRAAERQRRAEALILGMCSAAAVMLLFLQGSDGGVMIACVALWLCFWLNREKTLLWEPLLLLLTAVCAGIRLWGKEMQSLGTYEILLQDGISKKMAAWWGWIPLAALCLIFCGIHYILPGNKKKILQKILLCGSLLVVTGGVIWYIHHLWGSDFAEWGNRRGMLWQMARKGFEEGNLRQKLLGAGPDCFASYLAQLWPGGTVLFDKGYFAGSVFTNAHNEWLTTLIDMGLAGTVAYGAVFVTALRKYRRNSLGILLLCTYGMHSLISFQQVLNAPLFFLLLGVCEAESRMEKDVEQRYMRSL